MDRRLFLADPACAVRFGHNPQSLIKFNDYFAARGFDVQVLVCRDFVAPDAQYAAFRGQFDYFYDHAMPTNFGPARRSALIGTYVAPLQRDRLLETKAAADWTTLFQTAGIGADDCIFCPSADYYGTIGLLKALAQTKAPPHVHLRFLGVLEHARAAPGDTLPRLGALLNEVDPHAQIELSAESHVYARHLGALWERRVTETLFPLAASINPIEKTAPFIVHAAGSGRIDKGFIRILSIATMYAKQHPDDDVVFRLQALKPIDERVHELVSAQLYAAPNVDFLDYIQSDAEMASLYDSANFMIMPYDIGTYKFRGSASTSEALARARPLGISACTGFHTLVERFSTSVNCATDQRFCDAIRHFSSLGLDRINEEAAANAKLYAAISAQSMSGVFAWTSTTE